MAIKKTGSFYEDKVGGYFEYGVAGDGGLSVDGGSKYSLTGTTKSEGYFLRVGRYTGNDGTLTVTGKGSLVELLSAGAVNPDPNGSGRGAGVNIGRDGGNGVAKILDGGTFRVIDKVGKTGASDDEYIYVGRDGGIGSLTLNSGTVEVKGTGAGLMVGRNDAAGIAAAKGTLVVENGSLVRLTSMALPTGSTSTSDIHTYLEVGRGKATGTASIKNSTVEIDSGSGEAYLGVGRNGGTGTLTVTGTGDAAHGVFLEGSKAYGAWVDIGRHADSKGTATFDKARLEMVGTDNTSYASLRIGRQGGEGKLTLKNGAVLDLKAGGQVWLNVGQDADSLGTFDVKSSTVSVVGGKSAGSVAVGGSYLNVGVTGAVGTATFTDSKVTIADPDGALFGIGYGATGSKGTVTLVGSTVSLDGGVNTALVVGTDANLPSLADGEGTGRLVLQGASTIAFGKSGGQAHVGGVKGEVILTDKSAITGFTKFSVGGYSSQIPPAKGLLDLADGTRVAGGAVAVTKGGTLKAGAATIESKLTLDYGTLDMTGSGLDTLSVKGSLVSTGGAIRLDITKTGADRIAFTDKVTFSSGKTDFVIVPNDGYWMAKGETKILMTSAVGFTAGTSASEGVTAKDHHADFGWFVGVYTAKPKEYVLTALNDGKSGGAASLDLAGGTKGAEVVFDSRNGDAAVKGGSVIFGHTDNVTSFLGTKFADTMTAGGGKIGVSFSGEAGNDTLSGSGGADKLTGGLGADTLTGRTGNDTFIFKSVADSTVSTTGRDTIMDFAKGDLIDLAAIDANTATAKNDGFSFIETDKFSKTAGELRYEKVGSDTFVYGDVNGDGKADFAIKIDVGIDLAKGDFLL